MNDFPIMRAFLSMFSILPQIPYNGSMEGTKIARHSIANVLRYTFSLPIALLLPPYMLARMGGTDYGVWALLGVFASLTSLADLGMGTALSKYVAQYHASGETDRLSILFSTAFLCYWAIGGFVVGGLFLAADLILGLFFQGLPYAELHLLYGLSLLIFLLNHVFSVYTGVVLGLRRFEEANLYGFLVNLLNALLTVLLLERGWGLRGLLALNGLSVFLVAWSNRWIISRQLPDLRFRLTHFRWEAVAEILRYSTRVFVTSVTHLIHTQADKLILSHFLGVSFVAPYHLATQILNQLRNFPMAIVNPLMPAASALQVQGQDERTQRLYLRAQRYNILVAIPIFLPCLFFARPLIELWLGKGQVLTAFALGFLAFAHLINLLTAPGFFILNGIGRPEVAMRSSLLAAFLNIVLSLVMVKYFGFSGVVWATTFAMTVAALYFMVSFHAIARLPLREAGMSMLLRPLLAGTLVALPGVLWPGWPMACFLAYPAACFFLGCFEKGDVEVIKGVLKPLGGAR